MKKIFILDDEEDIVLLLRHVLSAYELMTAYTTEDLAGKLRNFAPDLLLIDNHIGSENAGEILDRLKASWPGFEIPVVLFSGAPDLQVMAEEIGVSGYISKPGSIAQIREVVKGLLGN